MKILSKLFYDILRKKYWSSSKDKEDDQQRSNDEPPKVLNNPVSAHDLLDIDNQDQNRDEAEADDDEYIIFNEDEDNEDGEITKQENDENDYDNDGNDDNGRHFPRGYLSSLFDKPINSSSTSLPPLPPIPDWESYERHGGEEKSEEFYPASPLPYGNILIERGQDLTRIAAEGKLDLVYGRDREISQVTEILRRRIKRNPVLIGEAGVGKTAIVEALAQMIIDRKAPPWIENKKIISISLFDIIAQAQNYAYGEYAQRLKDVIEALISSSEEEAEGCGRIAFFDEIHVIREYFNGYNYLKQYLARGQIQLIGATTVDEYRRYIERDPALERRFAPVLIEEPDPLTTVRILKFVQPRLEKYYNNLLISDSAIDLAVELSHRYIHDRKQPDKAIDVIERSCVRVLSLASNIKPVTQSEDSSILGQGPTENLIPISVEEAHVRSIISEWTGIPDSSLTKEREKYLNLADELKNRVLGQEEGINQLVTTIQANIAGTVSNPNRPSGVFLFVGPSGVGKTELAKALAVALTGKEENLVALDMTGYRDSYTVASLVGIAKGNVDTPEVPTLTKLVRDHPFGVLLLDEIEKAHPEVWSLFLPVFDEGWLVDRQGTRVHFRDVTVIMTANVDVVDRTNKRYRREVTNSSNNDVNKLLWKKIYQEEVYKAVETDFKFPKEFINRIDNIIVYYPLSKATVMQVLQRNLKEFEARMEKKISVSPSALNFLLSVGYKPEYGAREIRRAIDRYIGSKLAIMKLKSDFESWDLVSEFVIDCNSEGSDLRIEPVVSIIDSNEAEEKNEQGNNPTLL